MRFLGIFLCLTLVVAAGCRRKKGPAAGATTAAGDGVRFELHNVEIEDEAVGIALVAYNDLDQEVVVNRNQIAVIAPDTSEYYRVGSREIHKVPPHGKHDVNMGIKAPNGNFRGAKGVYLRFDGVYAGTQRLNIAPMAVGQPAAGPGQTNTAFLPPSLEPKKEKGVPNVTVTVGTQTNTSAPPPSDATQVYRGPRRNLKKPGTKCAAVPLKATDIPQQVAFIMDELLLTELQQSGFEAIGPEDINAMVGFEKVKDAVGCDDAGCIAELGNALGVDYLVAGNVASLNKATVVTLKIIDVRNTKVLARANRMGDGGQGSLPRMIGEAVQELIERSSL